MNKVLTIDIFKNKEFWDKLAEYNIEIKDTISEIKDEFNFKGKHHWANPNTQHLNPISRTYPNIDPIQYEERWKLILSLINYTSIFVINELYKDRKDILIEDTGCGIGYFIFYMHKLGFNNFSLLETFIEVPNSSLLYVMKRWGIDYVLNDINAKPIAINHCGPPYYPRQIKNGVHYLETESMETYKNEEHTIYIGDQIELFCSYQRHGIPSKNIGDLVPLAVNTDEIMGIYCRKDKYEEFYKLLESYKI